MKTVERLIIFIFVVWFASVIHVPLAQAATGFSNMSSAGFRLVNGGMSSLGGAVASADGALLATNMSPYQRDMTVADYAQIFVSAKNDLNDGVAFRDTLSLFDIPDNTSNQWKLLNDPKLNYESAGLITPEILGYYEARLLNARNLFGYGTYIGYAGAEVELQNALRTLVTIYLTIADEFLSDALESRFSDMGVTVDIKLNEQIALLSKAQTYYEKALNAFVFGFTPALDRSVFISQYFDEPTKILFNVALERLVMTIREKTAKILVKEMSSDPLVESNARKAARSTLSDTAISAYVLTSTISAAAGSEANFLQFGGQRLVNALKVLQSQGSLYRQDINPLGYDNRYVPLGKFEELWDHANSWANLAGDSELALANEKRTFESNLNLLQQTLLNLATNTGGYKLQLAELTGVSIADAYFLQKSIIAGEDLIDGSCPIDGPNFDSCITNKTSGILRIKYSQLREAQIRVDSAILREQNIQVTLESEEQRHAVRLEIYRKDLSDKKDTLKNYLEQMKNSRTITKSRQGNHGVWKVITSFDVRNDNLGIDFDKEVALQQINFNLAIAQTNLTDESTIENLLHSLAEAKIETGLAIQQQNSAYEDFYNTYKQKNNLVFLYTKTLEQANYDTKKLLERLPETKVLQTQAALKYSKELNAAIQFAYLTAKALEYKYVTPIDRIPGLVAMSLNDLYRAQTIGDVKDFLVSLKTSNNCDWQGVTSRLIKYSLAFDKLGLTDKFLNPDNSLTLVQVVALRKQKVQEYIIPRIDAASKSFKFNFSTALTDLNISIWNKYNLKIWYGTQVSPCPSITSRGVAVYLNTEQSSSNIVPYVTLTQRGHQTFLNSKKEIKEYVPTSNYLNMTLSSDPFTLNDNIKTTAFFDAYFKVLPTSVPMWDNSFWNRSIAASDWELALTDNAYRYDVPINWTDIDDIEVYFDTVGSNIQ